MAQIQAARSARDPTSVEGIYADDFYGVYGNGDVAGKAEWLHSIRAAAFSVKLEEMRFRHYGNTVLLLADSHVTGSLADGRATDHRSRVTYVWLRRNARWTLAAMHGTRIAK
jgi:ketosteroid isomerase-like protein